MAQNLCQICQKNVATVHEYLVAEKKENHYCEECFRQAQGEKNTTVINLEVWHKLLANLTGGKSKTRKDVACPACGMLLAEFQRRGQLGCEGCYDAFRESLEKLLESIHDASRHTGRSPQTGSAKPSTELARRRRLEALQGELQKYVQKELYEEAARIRDEIRNLEEKGAAPPQGEER